MQCMFSREYKGNENKCHNKKRNTNCYCKTSLQEQDIIYIGPTLGKRRKTLAQRWGSVLQITAPRIDHGSIALLPCLPTRWCMILTPSWGALDQCLARMSWITKDQASSTSKQTQPSKPQSQHCNAFILYDICLNLPQSWNGIPPIFLH